MRVAADKREELRENEGGSVMKDLNDLKEDSADQSPRKRMSRAVSYHR